MLTDEVIQQLDGFNDSRQAAATMLLETDLPPLADKYGIVKLFYGGPHSLRRHTTLTEYAADFVQYWLRYVEVAERKRPGATVDVGYSAPVSALDWLRRRFPEVNFRVTRTETTPRDDEPQAYIELPIDDYRRCVERVSDALIGQLSKPRSSTQSRLVTSIASTHGVYIPAAARVAQTQLAQSLADRGWPEPVALPGQHKVLISIGALDRFRSRLQAAGRDEAQADDMARRFSVAILVHEHFHAAVAAGLDGAGHAAAGAEDPDRWGAATALNEALAAWCERHFYRSDPEMLEQIDNYIGGGLYPAWPYRGAQAVESFFSAGGTPAVRGWMRYLRDDPENAQREFDQQSRAPTPSA